MARPPPAGGWPALTVAAAAAIIVVARPPAGGPGGLPGNSVGLIDPAGGRTAVLLDRARAARKIHAPTA